MHMKIGIDITPITRTPTGIGMYTRHLLHEFASMASPDTFYGFAAGLRPLDTASLPLPYVRLMIPSRLLFSIWEVAGMPRVDRVLGGLDVFHAVNYALPPLKSAKGILTIHDLGFLRNPDWFSPKIMRPFSRGIHRYAHRANRIIAVSQATKDDIVTMLDIPPEHVQVVQEAADKAFVPVPHGPAARRVADTLGITGPYILFVGNVELRKNVIGLLNAFSRAKIPHLLVVAGPHGWGSNKILDHVTRLNLSERVRFTGYIRDRAVFPSLYSAADAFIFPSWHEGFGLPVLEAMACGCPVITSNSSSLPEIGGDAAVYVAPEDTDGLAEKIEMLVGEEQTRAEMRERGFARARQFSWRRCAEETLACYHLQD